MTSDQPTSDPPIDPHSIPAQATQALVLSLKDEAEGDNNADHQQRLMAAAKMLADATAKMVQAAKGCASSPQDSGHSDALKSAADALRTATAAAEGWSAEAGVLTGGGA